MREEFEARGLRTDGMNIEGRKEGVRGTMEVFVRQPTVGAEWGNVKVEVRRLVDAALVIAGERVEGRLGTKASSLEKKKKKKASGSLRPVHPRYG